MSHIAIICAVAAGLLIVFAGVCRAAAPNSPAVPGIDWPTVIALGLAALAGVRVVVDALLAFFKAEAPLTRTLVDDHIRDSLQTAHDKLDQLAGSVNALVQLAKPVGGVPVIAGGASSTPPGPVLVKGSGTAGMLAVFMLGALAVPALAGCGATTKSAALGVAGDVVDCTAADRTKLEAQFGPTMEQAIQRATGTDGKVDLPSLASITGSLEADGWCVVEHAASQLIAAALNKIPGAPAAAAAPLDAQDLAAKVAALRVSRFGATTFQLGGP